MERLYLRLQNVNVDSYITAAFVLSVLLNLFTTFLFHGVFGLSEHQLGTDRLRKLSPLQFYLAAVILAPIVETFIYQKLIIDGSIKFLRFFKNLTVNQIHLTALVLSTVIFAYQHIGYSIWYFLAILPAGFILGFTYLNFKNTNRSAFWIMAAIHCLNNLFVAVISHV